MSGLGSVFFLIVIIAFIALRLRYSGHQHRYITSWNSEEVFKNKRETVVFNEKYTDNGTGLPTHTGSTVLDKMQKFEKSASRPEKKNSNAANNNNKSIPPNIFVDSHLRVKLEKNAHKTNFQGEEFFEVKMRTQRPKKCSRKSVFSNEIEELQIRCQELNKKQRKQTTNLKCSVFYCDEGCFYHCYPHSVI